MNASSILKILTMYGLHYQWCTLVCKAVKKYWDHKHTSKCCVKNQKHIANICLLDCWRTVSGNILQWRLWVRKVIKPRNITFSAMTIYKWKHLMVIMVLSFCTSFCFTVHRKKTWECAVISSLHCGTLVL